MCRRWWVLRDMKAKAGRRYSVLSLWNREGSPWRKGEERKGRRYARQNPRERAGCGVLSPLQRCVVCYPVDYGKPWRSLSRRVTWYELRFNNILLAVQKGRGRSRSPFGAWCNNMGGSEYSSRCGEWQDAEHILKRKPTNFHAGCDVGREREESKKMPGLAWVMARIALPVWRGEVEAGRWRRPGQA